MAPEELTPESQMAMSEFSWRSKGCAAESLAELGDQLIGGAPPLAPTAWSLPKAAVFGASRSITPLRAVQLCSLVDGDAGADRALLTDGHEVFR